MIKYGDLLAGYKKGVVRFIPSPDGDGELDTVCKIGDNWFYFGGQESEVCSPLEYLSSVGMRFAIECVHDSLNGHGGMVDCDPDEYAYYEAVLNEAGCTGHIA